ncbi:MAG: hypothetical protein PF637_05185 [Spirochaetes bacterium]|jgi:hypothetical protein|nr:hypothetical protein [Spirochaetota bacterium]
MKKHPVLENFIFICIVLVLIQTFLDDFSVMRSWSVEWRNILLISGFTFDLIFSIEFITRSIANATQKKFVDYFAYRRGWIDFLSSLPLLLLNSGPSLYILLYGDIKGAVAGVGILNALKVVKAIRVTRVLRLIRIVKIFGKIHNTESQMAQHHVSVITTTAVFSIIISLIIFSALFVNPFESMMTDKIENHKQTVDTILEIEQDTILTVKESARLHFKNKNDLLRVMYQDEDLYPFNDEHVALHHTADDIRIVSYKGFIFYFSLLPVRAKTSFLQIQYFFIIIIIVLAFSFVYSRHFAQNVSDVLHILNRGFRKKEYNLQVKINKKMKDHAVFKVAQFYNDAYLPSKLKQTDAKKSLSMKDLLKFNK